MITRINFAAACYSLSKAKSYVITIVLTLGITLGALVAMFNLSYQLLATPLPYPDQERLYIAKPEVYINGRLEFSGSVPYPALVEAYTAEDQFLEKKALVKSDKNIISNLSDTPQVSISYITPEYLQLLGSQMHMGRIFSAQEGLYSYTPVTVISYSAWQKIFNRDPGILEKSIQIGETSFKIIGVLADSFTEPTFDGNGLTTQLWLPWDYAIQDGDAQDAWGRFRGRQHIVGKLKAGQQTNLVEQALSIHLSNRFVEQIPDTHLGNLQLQFKLVGYQDAILGDVQGRLLLLFSGALVLLFMAIANITSLMLARVSNQQKALAIRAALGAQKRHIFSDLMGEILLLVLLALGLALLVAQTGIKLLTLFGKDHLPRVAELQLSWQSLLFTAICGLVIALAFAFVVSHQINYRALYSLLQGSGKGTGIQVSAKVRRWLIASQVMLTSILLAASLQVLVQSLSHIRQPLGFATDGIYRIALNISTPATTPISQQQKADLLAIHHALLSSPKIASASLASDVPTSLNQLQDYLSLTPDYNELKRSFSTFIDPQYLTLLGFEFIAGRNFTPAEFNQGAQVIIINETFARELQPDGKVLQQRFYWKNAGHGKELNQVIGIVKDLKLPGVTEAARMFMPYVALYNESFFLIELKPQQSITPQEVNAIFSTIGNQYKVSDLHSMNALHHKIIEKDIIAASLTMALALLTLGLAAIGIYGVLSYSVQLRQLELGIRMAIGARPNIIFLTIFTDTLMPIMLGLAAAVLVATGLFFLVQHTHSNLKIDLWSWLLPIALILTLTTATSLLSVWHIIRKPASFALKGN